MDKPIISIITITYNNPHLTRTLDSALSQVNIGDKDKIEHIIVDNLSTDETESVVKAYIQKAKYKVSYIREGDNGRYDGMNKGIHKADGKYLLFLNAGDNFFDEKSLENFLDVKKEYDIIYGNLNVRDGKKSTTYIPPNKIDFKYFLRSALPHQSSIIKKEIFEKYGFYDDKLKISSDWKFFILAICKYNCSYFHLNKTISTYYFDGISSKPENSKLIEAEKNKVYDEHFSRQDTYHLNDSGTNNFVTPILFIIFNRPEVTEKVFLNIRKQKPKFLFVAADGFRQNKSGEKERCQQTRDVLKKIDWKCEAKTLFRNENLGCGHAVSGAISWFFDNVEEGIILEDDCSPDQSFFPYCETMLKKYRHDSRISHINGTSFVCREDMKASYYFSKYYHVWGWASWRRAWNWYEFSIRTFPEYKLSGQIKNNFSDEVIQDFWLELFEEVYNKRKDTWDYQWVYANFINSGLSIMPFTNLVSNIGFGQDATHTLNVNDRNANRSTGQINQVVFPNFIINNIELDRVIYRDHIGLSFSPHGQLSMENKLHLFVNKIRNKMVNLILNSWLEIPAKRLYYFIKSINSR